MVGARVPWKPRVPIPNCWPSRGFEERAMILRHLLLGSTVAASALAVLAQPAAAAPWKRGFVVREYGFAFHYGGRSEVAETDPAADCARGSSVHFADETEMRKALEKQHWRSKQEIDYIVKPPEIDKARLPTYV